MRFEVIASSACCGDREQRMRDIIDNYPCLDRYGMKIERESVVRKLRIRDENNEVIYQEIPAQIPHMYIEINDLDSVIDLARRLDESIIIYRNEDIIDREEWVLEIYDDYRE